MCDICICLLIVASGCQLGKMIAFLTGLIPFSRDLSQLYSLESQVGRYGWMPRKEYM